MSEEYYFEARKTGLQRYDTYAPAEDIKRKHQRYTDSGWAVTIKRYDEARGEYVVCPVEEVA